MAASQTWPDTLASFTAWLADRGKRQLTIRAYRHDLALFTRWATAQGHVTPLTLTPILLRRYIESLQLEHRQAPATVNRRIISLRAFYRPLIDAALVSPTILHALTLLPLQPAPAPMIPLTTDLRRLTAALPAGSTLPQRRDYAMVQLALQAGLRLGDLAGLHLPDLKLHADPPHILIRSGKGGTPATVYLNQAARQALYAYLAVRPPSPSHAVFLSRTRGPMATRTMYDAIKASLRSRITSHTSPHTLRHIFATLLYRKHKDIVLVKEALRHRKIETSLRYTRKTAKEMATAIEESDLNRGNKHYPVLPPSATFH